MMIRVITADGTLLGTKFVHESTWPGIPRKGESLTVHVNGEPVITSIVEVVWEEKTDRGAQVTITGMQIETPADES